VETFTNIGRQGKKSREAFQIKEVLGNQVFWLILYYIRHRGCLQFPTATVLSEQPLMIIFNEDCTDCSWGKAETYFAAIQQNKGHYT